MVSCCFECYLNQAVGDMGHFTTDTYIIDEIAITIIIIIVATIAAMIAGFAIVVAAIIITVEKPTAVM